MNSDFNQKHKAIDDYSEAIRLNPTRANAHIKQKNHAKAYKERGNNYLRLDKSVEVVNDFQMTLRLNPDDQKTKNDLKNAFSSLGEPEGLTIYVKTKIKIYSLEVINQIRR
ncbi:MAG: hypothetical protein SVY15_00420 [Halobacteriota archaeon]|nr:hypothetical protein [Halobacteriota archaeon]